MDATSITPSPQALRALAHPTRLRMLGILRIDGPATATTLATRLGLNTGATSYHLRQLGQHGFVVEDTERGNGRDRWWKAAHRTTVTETVQPESPEEAETVAAYLQAVAMVRTQTLQRSVEEVPLLPKEWADAVTYSDWLIRLSPERAKALMDKIEELVRAEAAEAPEADATDESAVQYVVQLNGFPYPGHAGGTDA